MYSPMKLCFLPLMAVIAMKASRLSTQDLQIFYLYLEKNFTSLTIFSISLILGWTLYIMNRPKPVYLVDFSCYLPPSHLKVSVKKIMSHVRVIREQGMWAKTGEHDYLMDFVEKILERSGLGQETYIPEGLHCLPLEQTMAGSRKETEDVILGAVDNVLRNTGVSPSDIGGAAVLLSNVSKDRERAKYKLVHTVRVHTGSDDKSYGCARQEDDEDGLVGVSLSKDLPMVAARTLKINIATLGPHVLPIREKLRFFVTFVRKKFFNAKIKHYMPDFKLAFEHFCIHAGGRALIDELEKNLHLSPLHVEASRMTLHRFGNTSSSSIWYELAYTEAKGRMKKGDRIWQIALGSGFKCNSSVWVALRNVMPSANNPWEDCLHKYPVEIDI
ncbi:hypothetical protein N665_0065s0083 [Sinapis alba]|nr:hypothetical protein N665_0065s0083 [Sinapis alba]